MTLTLALITLITAATAQAALRMTPVERAIILCETGMNWKHHSVGRNEYEGAPGFLHSTWVAFKPKGAPAHAYQATPDQQILAMRNLHARYGYSGWGCWTHNGYKAHL